MVRAACRRAHKAMTKKAAAGSVPEVHRNWQGLAQFGIHKAVQPTIELCELAGSCTGTGGGRSGCRRASSSLQGVENRKSVRSILSSLAPHQQGFLIKLTGSRVRHLQAMRKPLASLLQIACKPPARQGACQLHGAKRGQHTCVVGGSEGGCLVPVDGVVPGSERTDEGDVNVREPQTWMQRPGVRVDGVVPGRKAKGAAQSGSGCSEQRQRKQATCQKDNLANPSTLT